MKTSRDPRHLDRIEKVKALYTYSFAGVSSDEIEGVLQKLEAIDVVIQAAASRRTLSEMNKIDLAILREGVFELMQGQKAAVVIDEMVEVAKTYGSDASAEFIHAMLDKISKSL